MFFSIDLTDGLPIYEQIVRQVKFAVAGGALRTGELVPSVRELAHDLAVNPNTVAKAYRQLQSERVVEVVRGTGLAITSGAKERCRNERMRLIRARIRQVLQEARRGGLDPDELRKMVETELATIEQASAEKPGGK